MGKRLIKSVILAMACVAFIGIMAMSANAAGTYSLNLQFEKNDLKQVYAEGMQVILVKEIVDSITGEITSTPVVWAAFHPFENNVIEWNDEYGLYVSDSSIEPGSRIHKLTDRSAVPNVAYGYRYGAFENPRLLKFINSDEYVVQNCEIMYADAMVFGMAQSIIINGEAAQYQPINAVGVPYERYQKMAPKETLKIYVAKNTDSGTILDSIPNGALTVTYGDDVAEHTVVYDDKTGQFKLVE